jgi:hypothetical protein
LRFLLFFSFIYICDWKRKSETKCFRAYHSDSIPSVLNGAEVVRPLLKSRLYCDSLRPIHTEKQLLLFLLVTRLSVAHAFFFF